MQMEEQVAHHFIEALEKTSCKQIIFLSEIIEDESTLFPHLRSRLFVEKTLQQVRSLHHSTFKYYYRFWQRFFRNYPRLS